MLRSICAIFSVFLFCSCAVVAAKRFDPYGFSYETGSQMAAEITRETQKILDSLTAKYNTSASFSLYSETFQVSIASGVENHATGEKATTKSTFPSGSETKSVTAVAVLQLAEEGKIDLDKPASTYLDDILQKKMGKTFSGLFNNDQRVETITTRHLLHMQAGVNDYDNNALIAWTLEHPNEDKTPWDFLNEVNKTLMFTPGQGQAYTSIGYILLGLELVQVLGLEDWDKYDQASPFKKRNVSLPNTYFPQNGPCTGYTAAPTNMIEQYLSYPKLSWHGFELHVDDITPCSCLNGWTCGNVAWTTLDAAKFFNSIATAKLVKPSTLGEMVKFTPMTVGWSVGLPYGLGLMTYPYASLKAGQNKSNPIAYMVGHGGEDYGSQGQAGWNAGLGIGTAMAFGSATGLQTDKSVLKDVRLNYLMSSDMECQLMEKTFEVAAKYRTDVAFPQFNCSNPYLLVDNDDDDDTILDDATLIFQKRTLRELF